MKNSLYVVAGSVIASIIKNRTSGSRSFEGEKVYNFPIGKLIVETSTCDKNVDITLHENFVSTQGYFPQNKDQKIYEDDNVSIVFSLNTLYKPNVHLYVIPKVSMVDYRRGLDAIGSYKVGKAKKPFVLYISSKYKRSQAESYMIGLDKNLIRLSITQSFPDLKDLYQITIHYPKLDAGPNFGENYGGIKGFAQDVDINWT